MKYGAKKVNVDQEQQRSKTVDIVRLKTGNHQGNIVIQWNLD